MGVPSLAAAFGSKLLFNAGAVAFAQTVAGNTDNGKTKRSSQSLQQQVTNVLVSTAVGTIASAALGPEAPFVAELVVGQIASAGANKVLGTQSPSTEAFNALAAAETGSTIKS